MPVVSPNATSSQPAAASRSAIAKTRSGGTWPSYGQPNETEITPSQRNPASRARATTRAMPASDSSTERFTFLRLWVSLADRNRFTSSKRSRSSSALSRPRSFGTRTDSDTPSGGSIALSTSAASASWGITSARTKLVTSRRRSPVRASMSISRTLSALAITSGSFWKPSRGPTSRTFTVSDMAANQPICRVRRRDRPARTDHRRHRRARVRARAAVGRRRCAGGRRLARPRARRGGGRPAARGAARGSGRGARERRRRTAWRRGGARRAVPLTVGESDQPARGAARRPDSRRHDRAARGRGLGQGDAAARGAAGLRRRAGAGDGPRRRDRRQCAPHGQRNEAERPRPAARRGRAGGGRQARAEEAGRRPDRADRRAAADQRGAAGDGALGRGSDAAPDLGQLASQDARRHPLHGAARAEVVAVLAGGTGGAKLAAGAYELVGDELTVIANTGDDAEVYGVHVSPDPDLVTYRLAGLLDERGWGIAGDSWRVMEALEAAGRPSWFRLGERDLAMWLVRTELLRAGGRLTDAHAAVVDACGVRSRVLPMSDEPVRTHVRSGGEWIEFQRFMIVEGAAAPLEAVDLRGVERAEPTAEVLDALAAAEAILIGPSNPVISIGPILALAGMRDALAAAAAPVVAGSPFGGGRAVKGPTDAFVAHAGHALSAAGIADAYAGVVDGIVSDEPAKGLPVPALEVDTLMADAPGCRRVAAAALDFARALSANR